MLHRAIVDHVVADAAHQDEIARLFVPKAGVSDVVRVERATFGVCSITAITTRVWCGAEKRLALQRPCRRYHVGFVGGAPWHFRCLSLLRGGRQRCNGALEVAMAVDIARRNRRATLEAKRAKKLELRPTMGDSRGRWLARLIRSKYSPGGTDRSMHMEAPDV